MGHLITFGKFNYKYSFIIIVFILKDIYSNLVIYEYSKKINKNKLLSPLLDSIGNALCFFPALIFDQKPTTQISASPEIQIGKNERLISCLYNTKYNENLAFIDLIKIFIVALLNLITDICYIILGSMDPDYNEQYIFMEILIWFLLPSFFLRMNNYIHQKISIIFITIIGIIKITLKNYQNNEVNYKEILLESLIYLINGLYFGYINGLMKFKNFSIFKCCYIFGFMNTFVLIVIYLIATYAPCNVKYLCGEDNEDEHFDDFYSLFQNVEITEVLILISYSILSGLDYLLINTIIFNFTTYHILIIFHVQKFVNDLLNILLYEEIEIFKMLLPLIILFFFEFIFILIFLEIIELNFCGLNVNLRKNIEKRADIDQKMISEFHKQSVIFIDEENNYFIETELSEPMTARNSSLSNQSTQK